MKRAKSIITISMLFSIVGLHAVNPETIAKLEKERKEEESRKKIFESPQIPSELLSNPYPGLLTNLPPDLKRELLRFFPKPGEVLNIPELARSITSLAATSKAMHATINNPQSMLTILKSLPRAGAKLLAERLQKMPGIKSNEVQAWLNSFKLEGGLELYSAIDHQDFAKVKRLLKNPNIDLDFIERIGDYGLSALLEASHDGYAEIVKLLLNAGANVDIRGADKSTPIMLAASRGYTKVIEWLLAAGANVNAQDKWGNSALAYASIEAHVEALRLLLSVGADSSLKNKKGESALDFATNYTADQQHIKNQKEMIKLLEDAEKAQKEKTARK